MYLSLSFIKRAAQRAEQYCKTQGISISHSQVLHLLAHVFHFKNYNTLKAHTDTPNVIATIKPEKYFLLEIDAPIPPLVLQSLIKEYITAVNVDTVIMNMRSKDGSHFFECRFPSNNSNNFLTLMMKLGPKLKELGATRIDLLRMSTEYESLSGFLDI